MRVAVTSYASRPRWITASANVDVATAFKLHQSLAHSQMALTLLRPEKRPIRDLLNKAVPEAVFGCRSTALFDHQLEPLGLRKRL